MSRVGIGGTLNKLYCGVALAILAAAPGMALAQSAPTQSAPTTPEPAGPKKTPAKTAPAKSKATTVEDVTVTAHAEETRTSIDRRSYDVAKDLQATTGSISDALRNVPSVEVDVNGNVSVRGDRNVTILVDGKPSAQFKGSSVAQALQQMPANSIARVEVITNPTAEFDPEGSGGIINLVTKKTSKTGRSGGIKLSIASNGGWNAGMNGAWRGEKLTVSGDLNLRHDVQGGRYRSETSGVDPSGLSFAHHSSGFNRGSADWSGGHLSLEYQPDPKDQLSSEVYMGAGRFTSTGPTNFTADGPGGGGTRVYTQVTTSGGTFSYVGASENWRRTFAGEQHDLSVSLDTNHNRNRNDNDWTQVDTVPVALDSAEAQTRRSLYVQTELKADYQRPMPRQGRLKTGLQLQLTDVTLDNADSRGPTPAALVPVTALIDRFQDRQLVSALYATYEQPMGDLTVLAGLRAETTRMRLDDVTGGQVDHSGYSRLYPSLHLQWKLDDQQQLTASYSRRVQRPSPWDLNPFRIVYSPFAASQGNPNLVPQETASYEAAWQYRKATTFYSATVYWRVNSNGVTDVQTDIGNGLILTTKANLAQSRNGGLELAANGKLTPTLNYSLSGDAHLNQIDTAGLGLSGLRSAWTYSGRGSLTWQATPRDMLQLGGNYYGRTLTTQGSRGPLGRVNIGYRHKIDDKFSLVFTGSDVFATSRSTNELDTATLNRNSLYVPRNRVFFLGLSYTFGMGAKKDQGFDFGGGGPPTR